jgi:2-oxoglutarate dehydrogenase E1 component
MNGAQIIIDQFIVAAEDKWGQTSGVALLLPHGFEGQGPEHSSARIERYLALCAEDNLRLVDPSTAAQYYHVLRRQALAPDRVPMVCFTPKRYLRMPPTQSPVAAFTDGAFQLVLDDPSAALDPSTVTRVVVCTGKIAHELVAARDDDATVAVVRVEQLYPWPAAELAAVLARYPERADVIWVQEEPSNMGPWTFVSDRLRAVVGDRGVRSIARAASASPASGSIKVHEREQHDLIAAALA